MSNPPAPHTPQARARLKRRLAGDLWRAIWRYRAQALGATGLMIVAKLAGVSVPWILKQVVDELARPTPLALLPIFLVLAYAAMRFLGDALGEARDVVFSIVTQRAVASMTAITFDRLHAMGARFHAKRETGGVVRDVQKGADGIGYLLGTALFTILPAVVEIAAVMIILVKGYAPAFCWIIIATFVCYAVYTNIFTRRRMVVQREVNRLEAQVDGRLVDSLLNHDTVKYFATEEVENERLNQVLERWVKTRLANQKALTTLHVGQSAVIAAGIAAVMLLAVQYAGVGRMSVGDLVLVNAYIIQVCMPLNSLGFVFRETNDAVVNVERMFEIITAESRIGEDRDAPHARPLSVSAGAIVFDHVNFAYDVNRPILRDVSFRVHPGKTLAVVGGSGSGKSTLVKLLFRLYEPDSGSVRIDDQDLRHVTQRSLREAVGIVPQDTVLFNDTIAYNIAYGRPAATRVDVVRAARAAQLDEFIERLPDHYETRVGERGVRLSGGERQRIAIARAILKDPRVIVFDEATSALDIRSERAIQTELRQLAEGRTSIVIAHRLSTIVDADWILVMEHGRLVEQGSHQYLLDLGGVYAQMWSLQRQQGELEHTQRKLASEPVALAKLAAGVIEALHDLGVSKQVDLRVVAGGELSATAHPDELRRALAVLCQSEIVQASPGDRIELRIERQDNNALISIVGAPGRSPRLSAEGAEQAEAALAAVGGMLSLMPVDGRIAYVAILPLRPVIDVQTEKRTGVQTEVQTAPQTNSQAGRQAPSGAEDGQTRLAGASFPGSVKQAPSAAPDEPLRGRSILVVDDQEETRDALEALLQANGAEVQLAASAGDALAYLQALDIARWPGTLLCDIMLGDDDGYALLGRIRQLEAAQPAHSTGGQGLRGPMPAIAMTGYADHADAQDRYLDDGAAGGNVQGNVQGNVEGSMLAAGFRATLTKPVPVNLLIDEIVRAGGT